MPLLNFPASLAERIMRLLLSDGKDLISPSQLYRSCTETGYFAQWQRPALAWGYAIATAKLMRVGRNREGLWRFERRCLSVGTCWGMIDSFSSSLGFSQCQPFSDNPQNPSLNCRELTFLGLQRRIEILRQRPIQVSPL